MDFVAFTQLGETAVYSCTHAPFLRASPSGSGMSSAHSAACYGPSLDAGSIRSGRRVTQHTGQCRGRTHVPMALHWHPGAAALPQGPQKTSNAKRPLQRVAHETGARQMNEAAHGARWVCIAGWAQRHSRMPRGAALSADWKGRSMKYSHLSIGRPVRRPEATEYDLTVAKDLSRRSWGVDWKKASLLPMLPLFFVATDGKAGREMAQRWQRNRDRKAA